MSNKYYYLQNSIESISIEKLQSTQSLIINHISLAFSLSNGFAFTLLQKNTGSKSSISMNTSSISQVFSNGSIAL